MDHSTESADRPAEPIPAAPSGIERFESALDRDFVRDVRIWRDHDGLSPLLASLESQRHPKAFFDAVAEAMVARQLLRHGCEVRFEVPTPKGKQCDFEVKRGRAQFYLHVKRLDTDRPKRRKLAVSSRLRMLERIKRPYIVGVRWPEELTDRQMQRFVRDAASFVQRAQIGDELVVSDDQGVELGGVRIMSPWTGDHVSVVIGLPTGFIDEVPRIRKLMHRARRQFMPKAANVVMVCSSHAEDADDVETVLLGSHIERWDAHPPAGRRVAHGRDETGMWSGRSNSEFVAAAWLRFRPDTDQFDSRLWMRENIRPNANVNALLEEAFAAKP